MATDNGAHPSGTTPPDQLGVCHAELAKPTRAPGPFWLLPLIQLFYVLAIAISVPVWPFIWTYTSIADGDELKGATYYSYAVTLNAFCELASASFLGVLSDRFGRKPFLLLATVGQIIDFSVAALATRDRTDYAVQFESNGHIWMFVARCVAGLCGNCFVFTRACVGDLSTPSSSARNFAILAGTLGLAFVAGAPVGAVLSANQLQLPMWVSVAMSVVNIGCILALQETLLPKHREHVVWWRANPVGTISFLLSAKFLMVFAVMAFLDQFTLSLLQTVFLPYTSYVYKVGREVATPVLVVFGVGQGLVFGLVMRPLVKRCGEVLVMKLGYCLTCSAFASLALLSYQNSFWLVYLAMVVFAFGAMSSPTEMAVVSQCVPATAQGKLQAANGCLDVIGKLLSALMASLVFEPVARAGQPGMVWWIASIVLLPGVFLSFRIQRLLPENFGRQDMDAHVDADDSLAKGTPELKLQYCGTNQDLIPVVIPLPEVKAADAPIDAKSPPSGNETPSSGTFVCFWTALFYSMRALGQWRSR